MKFDPRLFAGIGAVTGGAIAGNTGDDFEFAPALLGSGIGAAVGYNFDASLPAGIKDPLVTQMDISGGLGAVRDYRGDMLSEMEADLRSRASSSTYSGDFTPDNIFKTVNEDNIESAISHLKGLNKTDLNRTFINFKSGRPNSFMSLEDNEGNSRLNGYMPSRILVAEDSNLTVKQKALYNYYVNVLGEDSTFAATKVDELTPFLNRVDSSLSFADGKMTGSAFGDKFNIHLTQTLGDGQTTGYIANNNVYLANKFNIAGGLIAQGQGQTQDSFAVVASTLGLKDGAASHESLRRMLLDKEGISKEAVLGLLADANLSDDALREAVEKLESNMQWDEYSTSEHLKSKLAKLNNLPGNYTPQVSAYARSISNTVDYGQTLRYDQESNGILEHEGSALRSLKTTSTEVGQRSELQRMTGQLAASGLEVFSQVKADANTKFYSPSANAQAPSLFVPYGRNPNTVGRRALTLPKINKKTVADQGFEHFKRTFSGEEVLGSSVGLRAETIDMEKMGSVMSKVLGGNITLADGYSIANKDTMSRFEVEGHRKVKIGSNAANEVALRNPLIESLMTGSTTIVEAQKKMTGAGSLVRYNTKQNQEKVYNEFANAWSSFHNLEGDDFFNAFSKASANSSEKLGHVYGKVEEAVEAFRKSHRLEATDPQLAEYAKYEYFDLMSERLKLTSKNIDKAGANTYAAEAASRYNRDIEHMLLSLERGDRANADLLFTGAIDDFNERRREAIQSIRLLSGKSGQTIAYNPDGSAVKLPESYGSYILDGVQIAEDRNGKKALELLYRGNLNLGDNYVGKGFSINAKEQFILTEKDYIGKAGMLNDLFAKGHIKEVEGGLEIAAESLYDSSKGSRIISYERLAEELHGLATDSTADLLSDEAAVDAIQAYRHFSQNVDIISDNKNTGYGNVKAIKSDLKYGKSTSDYVSQTVWDSLREYKNTNDVSKKHLGGLVDYALATTNEKASLATLATVVTNNIARFNKLGTDLQKGAIDTQTAINRFNTLVPSFKPTSTNTQELLDEMTAHITSVHEDIASRFNTRQGVYEALTNNNIRQNDIDFFVRSSKFTDDIRKTKVNISSLNRRAIGETGAGLTDKSMSWNAQLQLLNNGYTHEDLDHFGKFNRGSYNDLLALTGMGEHHADAINDKLDYSRNAVFKNAFNALPEERRDMFKRLGINSGKSVDFYNLSYIPNGSFRSIPIIYDETRLFDSYEKGGVETNKRAVGLMYDIIQSDMELAHTKDSDTRKAIQERLDLLHSRLQGHIEPSLSGSTSAGKAALTREGAASMQATVGAINGSFSDFLADEKAASRHTSYVAVSEHGALKRLQLAGLDVKSIDELNEKHMERIGNTSLYRLKLDENSPFFGIVNREPATGPLSARLAEYIVDKSIYNSKGAKDSLFIKSEDLIYKYFQFGDYDFDNVTEYYMQDMMQVDKATRENILAKGRATALEYGSLERFASKLGVKNNKSSKMDSLFDVLEKNLHSITSEEDWYTTYLDYLNKKSGQAGLRKIVSPSVTMLSASLNNSLMRQFGDNHDEGVKAARVLTHYFVENLLKAQHASADKAGSATVAEDLANAREKYFRGQASQSFYTDMLEKQLKEMLQNHDPKSKEYELGLDAINKIVSAETTYMTDAPINPMEMGKANRDKEFSEKLKNLKDMVNGKEQGKTVINRVAVEDADIASLSKEGYDRFKNITKQMFHNNKKALALGAAGIAGVTLAFQDKPDYGSNYTATADLGRHTLAPNSMQDDTAREAVEGQSLHRSSEYLTPHRDARRAVTIDGQYVNPASNYRDDVRRSVFGDNINSAQVEYRE